MTEEDLKQRADAITMAMEGLKKSRDHLLKSLKAFTMIRKFELERRALEAEWRTLAGQASQAQRQLVMSPKAEDKEKLARRIKELNEMGEKKIKEFERKSEDLKKYSEYAESHLHHLAQAAHYAQQSVKIYIKQT